MKVLRVIEAKRWRNVVNGRTASLYGACPWFAQSERDQWVIETTGYTWEMSNGTIGLGRMPAKTYSEALEVMERVNNLSRPLTHA
jgi:hypothetical protein